MPSHRFRVGDTVRIVGSISSNQVESFLNMVAAKRHVQIDETWEVVRLLPPSEIDCQYHVRGSHAGLARVVQEAQLALV